jgi:hypothetical protein
MHKFMDWLVLWAATGFEVTNTALAMFCSSAQLVLFGLDQFFGSTDASRAIVNIIVLMRREAQNPATAAPGETVGLVDLVLAFCALAYLRVICGRLLRAEDRSRRVEKTVWDVVVLHNDSIGHPREHALRHHGRGDRRQSKSGFEHMILNSLPENANISITRELAISETVTVNVMDGSRGPALEPPAGGAMGMKKWDTGQMQEQRRNRTTSYPQLVFRQSHQEKEKLFLETPRRETRVLTGNTEELGVGLNVVRIIPERGYETVSGQLIAPNNISKQSTQSQAEFTDGAADLTASFQCLIATTMW